MPAFIAVAHSTADSLIKILIRAGLAAVAATGLSLGAAAVPASASPAGPGVTKTIFSTTTTGSKGHIQRRFTLPPGQSTGWQYHDGTLVGYVEQGTPSHFDASCASEGVYNQGSFIKEPVGADHGTSAATSALSRSSSTSCRTAPPQVSLFELTLPRRASPCVAWDTSPSRPDGLGTRDRGPILGPCTRHPQQRPVRRRCS
jgi:quercetin dioxygenase-like cupin family protein